jgi:surface protein
MFSNANIFNSDISNWNVSSVTNMDSMFSNAYSFNPDNKFPI